MKQTAKKMWATLALSASLALVGCSHPQTAEAQDWYTATGVPATGSLASSAAMRGEFQLIQNAFSRLPRLTGNNNEPIFVDAGGTGLEAVDAATARDRLGLVLGVDVQAYDADLAALANLSSTGLIARTGDGTVAARSITTSGEGLSASNGDGVSANPAISLADDVAAIEALDSTGFPVRTGSSTWSQRSIAVSGSGLSISNGDGVSGNPTISVADDLAAVEALSTTGLAARTGTNTWAARTLSVSGDGLAVTNGNGVSGNPTLALDDDLAAVEALSSTGCVARTASNTWNVRTITGTSNEVSVTNGDCVSGNPTISLPSSLTFTGKTVTGGTFSGPTLSGTVTGTYTLGGTPTFPSNVVLTTANQTLTNKTLTTPVLSGTASGTTAGRLGYSSGALTYGDGSSQQTVVTETRTQTLTNKTLTSPVISGGTIDGAVIGGTTPASASVTSLSVSGDITHTKACASGFARAAPGLCRLSSPIPPAANLEANSCTSVSIPPEVANKVSIWNLTVNVLSSNSVGLRTGVIGLYAGTGCSTPITFGPSAVGASAYEFSAISAGTTIASVRRQVVLSPIYSSCVSSCALSVQTGEWASGVISLFGYWDN